MAFFAHRSPVCLRPTPAQLINLLMNGGRLEIPPRERLPGEDTPSFAGLDDYISLLQ